MSGVGFWHFAQQSPHKLALAAPDGRHWSRGELLEQANQVSHGLRQLGLQPGDRVVAMLENCAELVAINLAVTQIGCILAPLRCDLGSTQIARILRLDSTWAFFVDAGTHPAALAAARETSFPPSAVFSMGGPFGEPYGMNTFQNLINGKPKTLPEQRIADSVVHNIDQFAECGLAQETGGETNTPEHMATASTQSMQLMGIQPEAHNVHYCGSGLYHPRVMNWAINSLHYGHALILAREWSAEHMLEAINKYRVTSCYMVPRQFEQLLQLPDSVRASFDVSSVRYVITSPAPCPANIKSEMSDWWGSYIYEYYIDDEDDDSLVNTYKVAFSNLQHDGGLHATPGKTR